jgi:antitoxin component of MazEF toxin-antitoxin module
MTQINSQGQIAIPPDLQQLLGLFPGTEVQIQVVGDALQLRKSTIHSRGTLLVEKLRGKTTNHLGTDDIMHLTRDEE